MTLKMTESFRPEADTLVLGLVHRFRDNVSIVGSATRGRSRREAEIDARSSSRPSNKELAASRPNPPGEWGLLCSQQNVAGDLFVRSRRRCRASTSSSFLDLDSQDPFAIVMLFRNRCTRQASFQCSRPSPDPCVYGAEGQLSANSDPSRGLRRCRAAQICQSRIIRNTGKLFEFIQQSWPHLTPNPDQPQPSGRTPTRGTREPLS